MLARLFRPKAETAAAEALYAALIRQARRPELYRELSAPDTNEGRFEVYALHLAVLLRRLRALGAETLSQALFERFVQGLDDGLREIGVGDLSVGKKMRKLGEQLFGRLKGYDAALDGEGGELEALVGRTVFEAREGADATGLAAYAKTLDAAIAGASLAQLEEGAPPWPTI